MTTLSELNKREREIKGKISSLRSQMRKKKISKKEFDRAFESHSRELEKIAEQKAKLIGLPPIPPPPKPDTSKGSGLNAIKRIVSGSDIEPPGPPVVLKSKKKAKKPPEPPKPPKEKSAKEGAKKKEPTVIKERIKKVEVPVIKEVKVPVIKERIKKVEVPVIKEVKVPVIKEKIKEVKVPVIKEKIKKVPVIKRVEVPRDDPKLASKIEDAVKDLTNLKIDIARQEKEQSFIASELNDLKKRLQGMEGIKADIKALGMELRNIQKGGTDPAIKNKVKENAADIRNIQVDLTQKERELSKFINEIGEIKERIDAIEKIKNDVDDLKSRLMNIDFEGLSHEIYNQFERMNENIKQSDIKNDDAIEKLNVEIKTLKENMEDVMKAKEHIEKLDIPNIRRDMEVIRQKSQYLQNQLEKINIEPLVEMVREVENKMSVLQASSALIIE